MSSDLDEVRIRRRVEKRLKDRQGFYIHLAIMAVMVPFIWVLWSLLGSSLPPLIASMGGPEAEAVATFFNQFPAPLLFLVVAVFSVSVHGLVLILERRGEAIREQAIQREIERERRRLYGDAAPGKPKRRATLSDDGELVYGEEADESEAEASRRRSAYSSDRSSE